MPIQVRAIGTPLSVPATQFHAAVRAGARAVDIRTQERRNAAGALHGALAVDPGEALELLTPGAVGSLRGATADARWLVISDDGDDAEWLAWHLQARGVSGALFLAGGHDALRRHRLGGELSDAELAILSDHDQ